MKSLKEKGINKEYSIIIKKTPQKFLEYLNDKDYHEIDEKIKIVNDPFYITKPPSLLMRAVFIFV